MSAVAAPAATLRLGFVVEQSLGHLTHQRHLAAAVASDPAVAPAWLPVRYRDDDAWERVPLVRANWSLRGGLRGRAAVLARLREGPLDAVLFHTQVTALCAAPIMRRIPAVVSLDATPLNMDTVGAGYDHRPDGDDLLARLKRGWNAAVLRAARAVVGHSEWVRRSVIDDYGVDPARVVVIPPGADLEALRPGPERPEDGGPLRLLFVGGDFARKGGPDLLAAVRRLSPRCELDVVTRDPSVVCEAGVRVHRGLTAGDPRLVALFQRADALVLPTRGDCTPFVVLEGMAAGLPVVATRVGAIPEQVVHGETGLLVPPGDVGALAEALGALLASPARRRAMGRAGRARAEALFDAARNYPRLLALLKTCAAGQPRA